VVDRQQWRYAQHIDQWSNRLLMEREIRDKNDRGTIVTMELTTKQESFCQLVAIQQKTLTDAYIEAYDTDGMKQDSIYQLSCRLSKQVKITSRIEALQATITDKLASQIVWNREKIVSELAVNVELAREHKQMAASNRSLELVAKVTGVLAEETKQVTGTVSVIHSLSNEVLDQLAALGPSEPEPLVSEAKTIEAQYQILDTEPE